MSGIIVGLKNLTYSKLTTDSKTAPVYDAPKELAAAINAKITPSISTATLYADDVALATNSALGTIEVELEVDQLKKQAVQDLLGVTANADGVLEFNDKISAPYVAIGFSSALSDGGDKYVWLLKGQFQIPEEEYATKSDKLEFQTRTIKAQFITRADGNWKFEANSNDVTNQAVIDTWFDAVYTKPSV